MHYDASGINNDRMTTGNLCTVSLVELTESTQKQGRTKLDATIGKIAQRKSRWGNTGETVGYLYLATPLQSQILLLQS